MEGGWGEGSNGIPITLMVSMETTVDIEGSTAEFWSISQCYHS